MKFRLLESYEDTEEFIDNELLDEDINEEDDLDEYFYNHLNEDDLEEAFNVGDKVKVNRTGRKGVVSKKRKTLYDVKLDADRVHKPEQDVFYDHELSLTEGADIDTDITVTAEEDLTGPVTDKDNGISNLLIALINDEWNAISQYNDFIVNAKAQGYTDTESIINDIITEEHKHIGQLQSILKTISTATDAIDTGIVEGEQQMLDDDADDDVAGLDVIADATANYFNKGR